MRNDESGWFSEKDLLTSGGQALIVPHPFMYRDPHGPWSVRQLFIHSD